MSLARRMLIMLLFTWMPLQLFAWNWRTKVSLSVKDQPLSAACDILESRYGIRFSYSRDLVKMSQHISIDVQEMPLRSVLEILLGEHGIQYKRIGDQLVLAPARASASRTISGYVEDAHTGEKLIGATVWSPKQSIGTTTNQYGFYSLTTVKDTLCLSVSYVGYTTQLVPLKEKGDRQLHIRLVPSNTLQEVEVSTRLQDQTQMSKINIPVSQIKAVPRMLGEADVLRSIQSMPGVSGGMDGSSNIHVRGGSPDQNLILLDGTPVYNASHLLGIFSVFNPDIIKDVDLYKGAFPARYGGRLSSVVDISLKDGNMHEFHGEGSIGLLASRILVEGPIIRNKTSFIVSARRSYADLLLSSLTRETLELGERGDLWAYFYDANIRVNHIFSPRDRLYLSVYGGADNFNVNRDNEFDSLNGAPKPYSEQMDFFIGWGNKAYSMRWSHVFNPKLFSNATVNYSQYRFRTEYDYKYKALDSNLREQDDMFGRYYSMVKNYLAKIDFDYRPGPRHSVRFGAQATHHKFRPGVLAFRNFSDEERLVDTVYNDMTSRGTEVSVYAEDDWKISDSMHLNLGLHTSTFLLSPGGYISLQPRLGFRYALPRNWAMKLSYTIMTQYVHLLSNKATFLPTDLWVAATSKVPPMYSSQVAAGLAKTTNNGMFDASLEAYYKSMQNVIEYVSDPADFMSVTSRWDDNVISGRGWSYGGEVLLRKKKGKFQGWIGYTLAWSERAFPNVNQGKVFPYKYDRRHDLELMLTQRLGQRWALSASWRYNSGQPITLPTGSYEQITDPTPNMPPSTLPGEADIIGDRNMLRTHNVHRLDIGATHTKERKHTTYILDISLYNVYNRMNPFFYYYRRDKLTQQRELTMVSILPILPSISYTIRF